MAGSYTRSITVPAGETSKNLTHHELGWFPVQTGKHQFTCNGLGGGTYAVRVRVPGDATFQTHQTGATETDTVLVDRMIPEAFQIVFTDVPAEATPVVTVTTWPGRV